MNILNRAYKSLKNKKLKSALLLSLVVLMLLVIFTFFTTSSIINSVTESLNTSSSIEMTITPILEAENAVVNIQQQPNYNEDTFASLVDSENLSDYNYRYETTASAVDFTTITFESKQMAGDRPIAIEYTVNNPVDIVGTNDLTTISEFMNSTYALAGEQTTIANDEVVISEDLAKANNLEIGDTITLTNGDGENQTTYTVANIFVLNPDRPDKSQQAVSYNTIYTSLDAANALKGNPSTIVTDVSFYASNVESADLFNQEFVDSGVIDNAAFELTINDKTYTDVIKPLQGFNEVVKNIAIFAIGITFAIILVVIILDIRSRRREIGTLYSLGESKSGLILQLGLEQVFILAIGSVIVILCSPFIISVITNGLEASSIFSGVNAITGATVPSPDQALSIDLSNYDVSYFAIVFETIFVALIFSCVTLLVAMFLVLYQSPVKMLRDNL